MAKLIFFVLVVALILYLGFREYGAETISHPAKKEQRVQQDRMPETEEKDQEAHLAATVKKEIEKPLEAKTVSMPPKQADDSFAADEKQEAFDDTEEDEEEADETPSVKRSQLIGGADVEWIEPKPKDPDNKFGEPPM